MDIITKLLEKLNSTLGVKSFLPFLIIAASLVLACFVIYFLLKSIFLRITMKIIKKKSIKWHEILVKRKILKRLIHIIPIIIVFSSLELFGTKRLLAQKFAFSYLMIIVILVIFSLLDIVDDIYRTYSVSKLRPIKGVLQVVKILASTVIGIIFVSNWIDKSPLILLSGIGALSAVLLLVFKDSIMGFVAGIQLSSNDLLRIGDWIEMPKYGADGDIIDISLNTVKVQNFDKTIVSIPSYSLVSDSFKNWRGMREAGGRRIKRSIYIDMTSIKFCDDDMINRFRKIKLLEDYIEKKSLEIEKYNLQNNLKNDIFTNGRNLTNIGTFREYIIRYLKNHSGIHSEMTQMVRQLPPSEAGLPLEIYVFSNTTEWIEFENIQSDIFDHILAIIGQFDLRVYQAPTGFDLRKKLGISKK